MVAFYVASNNKKVTLTNYHNKWTVINIIVRAEQIN